MVICASSKKPKVSIIDLRKKPDEDLFKGFVDLYNKTFTNPQEREDPQEWPGRMSEKAPEPQPWTHLLVAISSEHVDGGKRVVGGIVFEHYRASHCGLLTYLVVDQTWRTQGLARRLVNKALTILTEEAVKCGVEMKAVFCETEDPKQIENKDSSMSTDERLGALKKLGACQVDFPNFKYVQPGLIGGAGPCKHLLLMTFDLRPFAQTAPDPTDISALTIFDFLEEFYRALGRDPDQDGDFTEMMETLENKEKAILNEMKRVAVCLHYVVPPSQPPVKVLAYPHDSVLQSMELDLMSYGYQTRPLLGSKREPSCHSSVEIEFPRRFEYLTEGRRVLLRRERGDRLRTRVTLSSTLFLVSGIRVWHVVLVPEDGETFGEFDIIKLIHLYDGRTEDTSLHEKVKFWIKAEDSSETSVTASKLLRAILGQRAKQHDKLDVRPTAGTVQIITGEENLTDELNLARVMKTIRSVSRDDNCKPYNDVKKWLSEETDEGKMLLALCGVITGIFDFPEVDIEEALDTLEPTFNNPHALLRIHRCTLVSVAEADRAMQKVIDHVGITPYLLLPHATLLHNEMLLEQSEKSLSRLNDPEGDSPKMMEDIQRLVDRNLNHFYLQNIFNYITEKSLFIRGAEIRGTNARLVAARARLSELDHRITATWEDRHNWGQWTIGLLLSAFTILGSRNTLVAVIKDTWLEPYSLLIMGIMAGAVIILYLCFGPKRAVKNRSPSANR